MIDLVFTSVLLEPEKQKVGSMSAVLNNGIHLSYSFYGPTGEYKGTELLYNYYSAIYIKDTTFSECTFLFNIKYQRKDG